MTATSALPITDASSETHGPGAWFHNPATGELGQVRVTPAETGGRRLETDLYLQPGAAVAGAHVHPHVLERFEVLAGRVGFMTGGATRESAPGDGPIEVPAGTPHDWWHVGDEVALVRVQVEAAPDAPGRPADRFVSMIEALWSLGALGRVNAKGTLDPLWLSAIAHEYRDVIVFTRPPVPVQRAVSGPLAAIARRRGRNPLHPSLHGPAAPCAVGRLSDEAVAELLCRPVGTRAARGHG